MLYMVDECHIALAGMAALTPLLNLEALLMLWVCLHTQLPVDHL